MKLIEAMKKVKDLARKAEDIRGKLKIHCAHRSTETPTYGDKQKDTVAGWLQAHEDILKEILSLRFRIQKTNVNTQVTITFGEVSVAKSIAEWIHRRRDLAELSAQAWSQLTDRGLPQGSGKNSLGEIVEVKTILNFDPTERDKKLELYRSEPSLIDANLEIVNAVTDLVE